MTNRFQFLDILQFFLPVSSVCFIVYTREEIRRKNKKREPRRKKKGKRGEGITSTSRQHFTEINRFSCWRNCNCVGWREKRRGEGGRRRNLYTRRDFTNLRLGYFSLGWQFSQPIRLVVNRYSIAVNWRSFPARKATRRSLIGYRDRIGVLNLLRMRRPINGLISIEFEGKHEPIESRDYRSRPRLIAGRPRLRGGKGVGDRFFESATFHQCNQTDTFRYSYICETERLIQATTIFV